MDIVTIADPTTQAVTHLYNQINNTLSSLKNKKGIRLTLDVKQWETFSGGSSGMTPPSRQVLISSKNFDKVQLDKHEVLIEIQNTFTNAASEIPTHTVLPTPTDVTENTHEIEVGC